MIIFCLRPTMNINGRIRVTGQNINIYSKNVEVTKIRRRGAWVAQLVKCLPSAQVMISGSWDRALLSGSLLSEESASLSPSATSPAHAFFLSQINKQNLFF